MILLAAVLGLWLHELAHAWVAHHGGDPLPAALGRVTLNPLAHLDPVGSVLLPATLALLGLPPVGWGRPVPLARPDVTVFLAGPLANALLALVLAPYWTEGALVNGLLAALNLLPIPGMDGGRIVSLVWRMS